MTYWDKIYRELLDEAIHCLHSDQNNVQVIVIKTALGNIYTVKIPNYMSLSNREPIENECIKMLESQKDTHILYCLTTINGIHPEICSWNFRKQLIDLNPDNLDAVIFLWGGVNNILVKKISSTLPPNK